MEQFSLEKYLANPSRKVVTRNGSNVRIICTDKRDFKRPIVALIEDELGDIKEERTQYYTKDGKFYSNGCFNDDDLFFSEKHEGWINIYRNDDEDYYKGKIIYSSKEDAIKRGEKTPYYITTTKIEWEE